MKIVLVGLVQGLGGWLLTAVLLSMALQSRLPVSAVGTLGISLVGGLLIWAAFGLFVSALNCASEGRALRRGLRGEPPRGGRHAVLVGVIEPLDAAAPLLWAPLDDSRCVAYAYQMKIDSGTGRRRRIATLARGVALMPSHIRTRSGAYRLLVVPDLEALSPDVSRDAQIQHFLHYAAHTPFTERTGAGDELLQRWRDDDGSYRSDVRFADLQGMDTRGWVPVQQHVPAGAPVCVFGRFDAAKAAVVPSATRPVRLSCGSPQEVIASLRSKIVTRALIGAALAAAAALLLASFAGGFPIDS